jgi:16S rRNA (guanine527-N7)-methyltransferase
MVTAEVIFKYFPELSDIQKAQFSQLGDLYQYHNERVNLISRKDIQNLYTNHILHSLVVFPVYRWRFFFQNPNLLWLIPLGKKFKW